MPLFWFVAFCVASQRHQGNDCNPNTRQTDYFPTPSYAIAQLSQNGKKLFGTTCRAMTHEDCYIEVLDAVSGATLSRILFNTSISDMVVAPNGERFFIGDARGGWIVETRDSLWTPIPISSSQAWSPDSLLLIGTDHNSVNLFLLNSSGAILKNWTQAQALPVQGICWAPGNVISISSAGKGGTMTRYYSNGTLASVLQVGVWGQRLVCSPSSTVAFDSWPGIALVDLAGKVTKKSLGGYISPVTWDAQGKLLISCKLYNYVRPCEVYDLFLERLLEIAETTGHRGLGISSDEATLTLVTLSAGGAFFWNIQSPQIRTFEPRNVAHWPALGWIDRDRFMIGGSYLNQEFNVRTGTFGFSYGTRPNGEVLSCVMSGELYSLLGNGTITIFAQGKELRRWDTGVTDPMSRLMSCSYKGQIAISRFRSVLVWSHLGQLVKNHTFSFDIRALAFYNTSRFALWNTTTWWMWNAQTSQLDSFCSSSNGAKAKWSPDGSWLVIQDFIWDTFSWTWKIYQCNGTYVMQIDSTVQTESVGQQADWSSDSNWLLLQGPPSLLVSPKLNKSYSNPAGGATWDEAWWNPETMEVLSLTESTGEGGKIYVTCNLWTPTPTVRELVGGKRVGVLAPTTVSLVGANLLPSSTKAMLRWVDTSTAVPQCMFLTAMHVDAFTFSLGNVTLPDPALYIVYLEHATDNPTSPWLGAQVSLAASCSEYSLPALSITGELTTCACLYDRYGIPSTNSGLQCLRCPPHGRCNGSSLVRSEEGYWPKTEDPFYFMPCAPGACPGDNVCSDYYEGPVCGLCKPGSGQYGFGRCRSCNSIWVDVLLLILGLMCWIAFCTLQSLFALGWRNNKSRGNNSTQLVAVIVSTTQIHALLLSVDVKLDSVPNTLGFTQDAAQGGGIQSAVLSCLLISLGGSPSSVHYIKQVVMLLLPVIGWVFLVGLRAFLRFRNVVTSVDVVRVPTVVLWVSLQSAITTSLLQTLQCTPVNSQGFKFRLSHDFSAVCYDTTYYTFVGVVTIPAIILTTIVIPVSIIWLLQYHPLDSSSSHLRFLVKNYRTHWWYLVIFYRKVLLSALVTFTKNPLYVAAALLGLAIVHAIGWPSTALVVNVSEIVSLTTSVFVFAAAGALGSEEGVYKYCTVVVISVSIFSYVIQSALLLHDRLQGAKSNDQESEEKIILEPIQPESDERYARLLN